MPSQNKPDQAASSSLEIICKPCGGGTCPTIYQGENGRIFLQGNKVTEEQKQSIAIAPHEGVVELDPSLLEFLKTL